ncbi:MAG TPA: ABC transporter ATP-binding protein [Chthonomonadaceae bacterium]|nr:ABC transporter ATP-binding protein [Chthonomonadaceae bacterium]
MVSLAPRAQPAAGDLSGHDAIIVSQVGKHFRLVHHGSIKQKMLGILRPPHIEEFTALKDISFRVPHGQTLAVIGRNGSGKSTLLSILARVYRPNTGTVQLFGKEGGRARVAPLLELGTGFHPELDGLENIVFYGSLLGYTAKEITARMDEIIAFSELGGKVDTPMRGWNEGAKLRLGFAVAVHTDPDIMLVDEVLAVGDEAFRKKCEQRIRQMQERGITIVFVSHDLHTVSEIADRVIWLNQGVMEMDGDPATVLQAYREAFRQP